MPAPDLPPLERLGVRLTTARLFVEPLGVEHAKPMFAGLRDAELYRYETDEPPATLRALQARYAELAAGSPRVAQIWLNWIVVTRAAGDAAGYVQATIDRTSRAATIGYLVLTEFQRRGFGGEAVGAACDHLEVCGITTLDAWIDVRNAASIALVERLGFARADTARSADVIGGIRGYDHHYIRVAREVRAPV